MDNVATFVGSCSFDRQLLKDRISMNSISRSGSGSIPRNKKTDLLHGTTFAIRKGLMYFYYRIVVVFPRTDNLKLAVALESIDATSKYAVSLCSAHFFCSLLGDDQYEPLAPSRVLRRPTVASANANPIMAYAAVHNFDNSDTNDTSSTIQFAVKFTLPTAAFDPVQYIELGVAEPASRSEQFMFAKVEDDFDDPWSGGNFRLSSGEPAEADRRVFRVHSAVLAAKSQFFEQFFCSSSDWSEKTNKAMVLNYPQAALYQTLRFIYVNNVDWEVVGELVPEMLDAANVFNLERLKTICHWHLVQKLVGDSKNWSRAAEYMFLADRYQLDMLKRVCSVIIVDYMEEFQDSDYLRMWLDSPTMAPFYHAVVLLSAQMLRAQTGVLVC